jgi:uncharacterized SAM-binding protein YcdF (DUF218 family)
MPALSLARSVWIFALLGPVFGYVTVIAVLTVASARSLFDLLKFPVAVVLGSVMGLPFAYLLGVVPAILVAFIYWWLRAKSALATPHAIALSAAAAVVVCAGGITIADGGFSALREGEVWFTVVLAGVVATPLCAALVERRPPD